MLLMTFRRYDRMLAMILTFAMIAGASACKHKTKTTETSVFESATEASTSTTETTESTTDTTPDATSETTEATTTTESTAVPESTDPSDTSETAVPSDNTSSTPVETTVAPADPTKAPDKPKPTKAPKATNAPKATSVPKPTTAPATSTPTPTTKPTDTPTPTTAPKSKDPGLRKNTGIGAAKDAVKAKCGSHDGFEFNDTVMSNEQARANACANNQTFYGHNSISGTFIPLEAAASLTGYIFDDGSELYVWTDHSGVDHEYSNFYDCVYACATYAVTEHTTKLSTESKNKYFGVGFAGYKDQWTEDEYGIITYYYYLYIGGDDDISRNARGY